jgi:hypothetical protein
MAPIVALVSVVAVGSAFLGAALNGRATRAAAAPPTVAPSPPIPAQPTAPAGTVAAADNAGALVARHHLVEATAVDAGTATDAAAASDRPVPMASVQVVAVPWGTVSIDGRPPVQERAVFRVPAGRHRIRAVCMGNAVVARTVNLHAGSNANELLIAPEFARQHPEFMRVGQR